MTSPSRPQRHVDQAGVVGIHLVLVIAFAFFAVTMLTRTTLAARHISEHVRVIVTEVGPGSNVSRLEETDKLNSIGQTAEEILVAVRPLSGQAGEIVSATESIDRTVTALNVNTGEITTSVRGINSTASELLPVVANIRGDAAGATGVAGINLRLDEALPAVSGISSDLGSTSAIVANGTPGANAGTIDRRVASIDCALRSPSAGVLGAAGGLLNRTLDPLGAAPQNCGPG